MQGPQPKISGTRDYTGDDAIALRKAREAIEATLGSYAYAAIDPPILERSAPFLNRSGEDIRRHMYIFPDPGGREVCLRPELTIPVCRAYLRQLQSSEDAAQHAAERETRLCYFGPAFRYESTGDDRYRQFYQAGAELIGAQWPEAADAEILAVAVDAVEAAGIKDALVDIGDVDIRNLFIDQLPIVERAKTRLRRLALRNRKEARFVAAAAVAETTEPDQGNEFGELASLLATVEPGKAELLIKEVLALADVRHVGGRTPEEIAERLTSRTAQRSGEPISAELMHGVAELLNIRDEPASAFAAIRDHFRKFGIGSIDAVLERCESRLRYFNAYRQSPANLQFNVGLQRGLEYYTGFLFEIYAPGQTQVGHVCGGGRYDNLLQGLGATAPIPAVGFGIGLDRLLAALQSAQPSQPGELQTPQALVFGVGAVGYEDCIRIGATLRRAGWSVATEASGRLAASALSHVLERKIPYLVLVDEDELKSGHVRVKRLDDRGDQLIALSSLATFAKSENTRKSAGRAS